ncbi:MAG: hypothetical protein A2452_05475 [Candidatus Firestonebacteria bacterium RIFOXYC2_FULL_39_67]|nr:MAG: hypothetical protein A2536_10305 [Candidatus Firestonebacteria bacterium RIFOXYD2_FULL_39_29]OGF52612.1 MAG: hypothetical protein A2497_05435 [Candidatus Firestonebacteria bacterium RifOxyC12_full_39_7]OGF56389.1 MAG: hypothetical protein A2452_05475 [Candidatus Firestonebacteria bacterium RIFOXYC2_FULL_39_67]
MKISDQTVDKRNKLVDESEISLVLDTYDDIFSDFDPRPYDHRVLSFDFLIEAKRAAREKVSGLELKFMLPENLCDKEKELLIRKRLHDHFHKHMQILKKERSTKVGNGILFALLGFFLTACAAVMSYYNQNSLNAAVMLVLLEPAGWFSIWNGLDMVFQGSKATNEDYAFYRKMATAEITFNYYK